VEIGRSNLVTVPRAATMNMGFSAAVSYLVTPLRLIHMATMVAIVGLRPSGSTCRSSGSGTEASLCGTSSTRNGGERNPAENGLMVNRNLASVTTNEAQRRALARIARCRVAQFEGGLKTPCSRLGRRGSLDIGLGPSGTEFVGTSLRCLGPKRIALLR
jgi:hypothetical protein